MTQPIALFLADILEDAGKPADIAEKCAAELRRLYAELERCKQVCAATSEAWRKEAALAEPMQEDHFCDTHCVWTNHAPGCVRAEPVQEPVAWMMVNPKHQRLSKSLHWKPQTDWHITWESVPLYATPPQRKPLTREEAIALWADKSDGPSNSEIVSFARAIERAHGII